MNQFPRKHDYLNDERSNLVKSGILGKYCVYIHSSGCGYIFDYVLCYNTVKNNENPGFWNMLCTLHLKYPCSKPFGVKFLPKQSQSSQQKKMYVYILVLNLNDLIQLCSEIFATCERNIMKQKTTYISILSLEPA